MRTVAVRAPVVLVGLALSGCPSIDEPIYGVSDTSEPPVTSSGDDTETGGETDGETGSGGATAGSGSGSSTGGADGSSTGGSDGTTGSSSAGEPMYGLPETTSG